MRRNPGLKTALSASALSNIAEYHLRPRHHLLSFCNRFGEAMPGLLPGLSCIEKKNLQHTRRF